MDLSADYHFSHPSGQTFTAISWGGSAIDSWLDLVLSIIPLITDLATAVVAVSMLFAPVALGTLIATIISLIAINSILARHTLLIRQAANVRRRNLELHIMNTLLCWRTVAECRKINVEKQRHGRKSEERRVAMQQLDDSDEALAAVQELVVTLGFLAASYYIFTDVKQTESGLLQLLTLLMYWTRATESVRRAGALYTRILNETQNTQALQSILQKAPSINPRPGLPTFDFKAGRIVFDDLSFSYDGKRDVIQSLSFTAKAGEKVALVGQSGSGKTTIFRLLSRHFDPGRGRVLVDDQDLRQVEPDSYRAILGIVSQNAVLLNATIRENVGYPCEHPSHELIVAACKAAEIHDRIMQLPQGYDQEVGELAGTLSGGEIQRLVLARLYVQDPKIVLLDEATSNLDSITERKTWELLDRFCRGRTTFIITHRLSTIRNVDRIIVIDHGKKTEEGTHAELVANGESSYLASLKAQDYSQVWS